MKTAVEFIIESVMSRGIYTTEMLEEFEQAKEMEEKQRKQDIINAWNSAAGGDSFHSGEEYYINLKSK